MSHQTGIKGNEALKKFFGKCRNGKVRVFKVSIENEELALSNYKEAKGSWEDDYDKFVKPLVVSEQPCYIMYRLDGKNETGGYSWLLISWSPDDSPVRQKMLYASTKATLKQEFGSAQIKEELHATVPEEVTLAGLKKARVAAGGPAPLTPREEELSELTAGITLSGGGGGVGGASQSLGSVSMPLGSTALQALSSLASQISGINYVRLRIDIPAEMIVLDASESDVAVGDLPSKVPEDSARYHIYRFKYIHENQPVQAMMFVYSMPGYTCPIKERMLYSSCKAPLLETVEHKMGLRMDKKLEIDSGKELTHEFLYDSIHPKMTLPRARFEKPKGPPNRGAKRLTKTQQCCL